MAKKALITGVYGQDGSYLTEYLLKKNYTIYGVPNFKKKYNNLHFTKKKKGIKIVKLDITNYKSVFNFISKTKLDEIYHLASLSQVALSFEKPLETIIINTLGTINILEAVRKSNLNIRFYQASSSEIFGNKTNKKINELTSFDPSSPYSISKITSHNFVKLYREAYNVFSCSGILFNHESPLRNEKFVTKKIVKNLCKIKKGIKTTIKLGNIYSKRDWGYAGEYVKCMWKIIQQDKPDDFIIATGQSYTVKEFINFCCDYLKINIKWSKKGLNEYCLNLDNNNKIIIIDKKLYRPLDIKFSRADISKSKKVLKWSSNVNIKKLIKIMCDYELKNYH